MPSSRGSSQPRDQIHVSNVSCIGRLVLYPLTPPGKTQYYLQSIVTWVSLVAQLLKNLPAMNETLVQFLGQEDLLEKE